MGIKELVAQLPEVYQPIFGYQKLSTDVSRLCVDRLVTVFEVYDALSRLLNRPLRVLDLGCAQGFFCLSLAKRGAQVRGVDYDARNIHICNALAEEHPSFDLTFEVNRIENVVSIVEDGNFDLVLGLSVFHHLVHESGVEYVQRLVEHVCRLSGCLVTELAVREEPLYWASAQADHPRALLSRCAFVHQLGQYPTHLSRISRPMFLSSNRYWIFGALAGEFQSWTEDPHAMAVGIHQGSRRYFFTEDCVVKLFLFEHSVGLRNRKEICDECSFLSNPPSGFSVPRLISAGCNDVEGWNVTERISGRLLLDCIKEGSPVDPPSILLQILDQLATLEAVGLYHDDVRTWNVLVTDDGKATLIDFGSISSKKADCVWPGNIYLAFFIFIREVATGLVDDPIPMRTISIGPLSVPAPYCILGSSLWKIPIGDWSFALMRKQLLSVLSGEHIMIPPSPMDEWMVAVEAGMQIQKQFGNALKCEIDTLNQLHNMAETRASEAETRASEAETRASEAETRAGEAEARAGEAEARASDAVARAIETEVAAEQAKIKMVALLNSTSWKITAPLRMIARWSIYVKGVIRGKQLSQELVHPYAFHMPVFGALVDWIRAIIVAVRLFGSKGLWYRVVSRLRRGGARELISVGRSFVARQIVAKQAGPSMRHTVATEPREVDRSVRQYVNSLSIRSDKQFRLTANRSIAATRWTAYMALLLRAHFPVKNEGAALGGLAVIIDCQDGVLASTDVQRTLASIDKLTASTGCAVRSYWRYEGDTLTLGSTSQQLVTGADLQNILGTEKWVLWIKPGDEVHPELALALGCYGTAITQFLLVDMYRVEADVVHPILLNGVDPVLSESVCYFLGRFVTTGLQVVAALQDNQHLRSDDLGRSLACRRDIQSCHIPLPLIRVNVTQTEYRRVRDSVRSRENHLCNADGSVSAIICTKNSGLLLEQLVGQLLLNSAIRDVVVVANNPTNDYALAVLKRIACMPRCTVLDFSEEFNFSKQSNLGAKHARGEYFLFINDDIAPITDAWLNHMLSWMDGPRIVGPLLVYPDQSIQHAGMFLGFNGVAGHCLRGGHIPDCDPDFMLVAPRQVSALTGAVMLMPREVFCDLNGFDTTLGTYLQDVDLCLRAMARQVELIFDPRAILIHMESVSIRPTLGNERMRDRRQREFDYFLARWGEQRLADAHLNPLIDRGDETLTLLRVS